MVILGHACQDENGGIDGAIVGDQTGKEIRTQNWYNRSGGWGVYLRPLDDAMADRAAAFVERICADDNYGYSQPDRWSGYKAIVANSGNVAGARGNFDCSSLVFSAYLHAGLNVGMGYTGNLEKYFMNTGKFKAHREPEYLESGAMSQRGGIYLMAGKHVAMVLSNSDEAMPDGDEPAGEAKEPSSAVLPPYVQTFGRVRVRVAPTVDSEKLFTAKDMRLPYVDTDPATKWHCVETDMGRGWISGKPNLTKVVTA